jgi:hypothetical protein
MDKVAQELFVLEVNVNCGIFSQPYSTLLNPDENPVK